MIEYEKARPTLKTGDILLFSGRGLISEMIKKFTRCKWSHVGLVIRSQELDTVLVFESTTLSTVKDIDSGALREGVQVVPLSERLRSYDGEVAYRSLAKPIGHEHLKKLMQFRREMAGRAYEKSRLELLRSAVDVGCENREDLSTVFCSELVAEAYQRLGLLDESKPSNEFTPADFSQDLPLIGASLGSCLSLSKTTLIGG